MAPSTVNALDAQIVNAQLCSVRRSLVNWLKRPKRCKWSTWHRRPSTRWTPTSSTLNCQSLTMQVRGLVGLGGLSGMFELVGLCAPVRRKRDAHSNRQPTMLNPQVSMLCCAIGFEVLYFVDVVSMVELVEVVPLATRCTPKSTDETKSLIFKYAISGLFGRVDSSGQNDFVAVDRPQSLSTRCTAPVPLKGVCAPKTSIVSHSSSSVNPHPGFGPTAWQRSDPVKSSTLLLRSEMSHIHTHKAVTLAREPNTASDLAHVGSHHMCCASQHVMWGRWRKRCCTPLAFWLPHCAALPPSAVQTGVVCRSTGPPDT